MAPRVLVVYKKSAYQLHVLERKDPHLRYLLRRRNADLLDLRRAHAVHERSLQTVLDTLKRAGVKADVVYRAGLRRAIQGYRLVISVGGDGTLLQVSHRLRDVPVLGVNSDRNRSEAVFCSASRDNVARLIPDALAGRLPQRKLYRLHVRLNGRVVGPPVLNDVLIAHEDPATMSRYRLRVDGREEPQKSSGLWISTAAGSSSAVMAAGGRQVPWTSRQFQYRPRELYCGRLTPCRLTGAVLPMRSRVQVTWLMREGAVFIDGPHVKQPLRFGDRVSITLSSRSPLCVLGDCGPHSQRGSGARGRRSGELAELRALRADS